MPRTVWPHALQLDLPTLETILSVSHAGVAGGLGHTTRQAAARLSTHKTGADSVVTTPPTGTPKPAVHVTVPMHSTQNTGRLHTEQAQIWMDSFEHACKE
jgi:hypothetical protein